MTWFKDGDLIMFNATQGDPHIMLDMFNTLHLVDVTQANKGNYTCFVGNVRMQEAMVTVVSRAKFHTQGKMLYLKGLGIYIIV